MQFCLLSVVLVIVGSAGQNDKGFHKSSSRSRNPLAGRQFKSLRDSLPIFSVREGRNFNQKQCDMTQIQKLMKEASCKPRPTVLPVIDNNPLVTKILPHHVVLQRCGGGTFDQQHGCIANKVETVNIPVTRLMLNGNAPGMQSECDVIPMEQHLTCKSHACKLKSTDCSNNQKFYPNECRCKCNNESEMKACEGHGRMWMEAICACECLPSLKTDCSTGFTFDNKKCRCLPNSRADLMRRNFQKRRKILPVYE